ncbi:hypothetical protein NDU88_007437, partial [Pleurodeles waltl]
EASATFRLPLCVNETLDFWALPVQAAWKRQSGRVRDRVVHSCLRGYLDRRQEVEGQKDAGQMNASSSGGAECLDKRCPTDTSASKLGEDSRGLS